MESNNEATRKTYWLFKQLRNFRVACSRNSAKAPPARPPGRFVHPSGVSGSGSGAFPGPASCLNTKLPEFEVV
eukprot:12419393-Alexandrium_andersonii.AAC.1